MYFKGPYVKNL